jgi:hypothetical protein
MGRWMFTLGERTNYPSSEVLKKKNYKAWEEEWLLEYNVQIIPSLPTEVENLRTLSL